VYYIKIEEKRGSTVCENESEVRNAIAYNTVLLAQDVLVEERLYAIFHFFILKIRCPSCCSITLISII